mgnify:CR=1 FL=1
MVGALDKEMAATAAAHGWPHLDVSALVASNSSFFRANFATFRNMGATKARRGAALVGGRSAAEQAGWRQALQLCDDPHRPCPCRRCT